MEESGWELPASEIPVIDLDLEAMKRELMVKIRECQERGLTQSFKWLAEILHALRWCKSHFLQCMYSNLQLCDIEIVFQRR